jgi:hypothetical protein
MKIAGHELGKPNEELCILPRQNGDIVFIAKAVLSFDEFDTIYPQPKPPVVVKPGGQRVEDPTDKDYISLVGKRAVARLAWMMLKSLEDTPGLSWERVDMTNPKTYLNFEEELQEAKFSVAEITAIQRAVINANSINEERVKEARENFLRGQQAPKDTTSGQNTPAENS